MTEETEEEKGVNLSLLQMLKMPEVRIVWVIMLATSAIEYACGVWGSTYLVTAVFYEILAEELSRRDMGYAEITEENYDEIVSRMSQYMTEFEASGVDRLFLDD